MKRIFFGIPEKFSLDALYPPTGLLYLAAAARGAGHVPKIVDAQVTGEKDLLRQFGEGEYDCFGTSILTPLRENSYDLIRKVKRGRPRCTVVAGGAHVSLMPEQTMRHVPEIDIVAVGEGEGTLVDLLSGKPPEEVRGIWFRRGNELVNTGPRPPVDPASLPMPAWDLIDITPYRAYEDLVLDGVSCAGRPFLTVYSSRGCTGACSFCSTWRIWRKWRQIPVEKVLDELEHLYHRGIDHFFIADDSMINDEEFVHRFADGLASRGIRIRYKIACRADRITASVAESLRRSGCYEVHIGFESGSQKILDSMRKGITVEENVRAAERVREAGMRVYALMIVGAIEETIETVNETIRFLDRIRPDVVASMGGLMLLPGTEDYRRAVREGFVSDDYWLGTEPFPFYTRNFSREELAILRLAIDKRCFLRSRRWMRMQMMFRHPSEYAGILPTSLPVRAALRCHARLLRAIRGVSMPGDRRAVGGASG